MLKVNGNFEKVKHEIKLANKSKADQIKTIKKGYKRNEKISSADQKSIDAISSMARIYSASKVLPVNIRGVVINHKLYESFMKKLKGFEVNMFTQPDGLTIQYWNKGQLYQGKGLLKLYNMSQYFDGFAHIPDAELVEDGEEA